jgi:hypothetical protein
MADVADGRFFLADRFQFAVAVDGEAGGASPPASQSAIADCGETGYAAAEREIVEAEAQVLDDFLGLARAAGVDDEPAVLRVDPDEGAALPGEGARHQFLGDALAQFRSCLAARRVALLARSASRRVRGLRR